MLLCVIFVTDALNNNGKTASGKQTSQSTKQPTSQSPKGNNQSKNGKSNSQSANKKTTTNTTASSTSADLKKQQQSVQAEVKKTQDELRQNEIEVKKNLNELTVLEDGIATSKKETDALSSEVTKLSGKISDLEKRIAIHNKELEHLRAEYLKAVKKMRISRKRNSGMSFLFSAKNIAQAERRMRYLKEFSDWKEKQTGKINAQLEVLKKENAELQRARKDKDVMLGREMKAQNKLNEQKRQQGVIVAELKANGDVLRAHLAKKQAEVNALKGQVAAVIAEEQRKADADRKRKEDAARAQREAAERKAAEEAAAKKRAQDAAAKKAAEEAKAKDNVAKKEAVKDAAKKDAPKQTAQKKEEPKKDTSKDNSKGGYAEARKRQPRSDTKKETPKEAAPKKEQPKEQPKKTVEVPKSQDDGGFVSAKGSLPRPVDGAFRVTGKFGRHALPDLPDVTYDNPGIDVEVAKGATAKCVYEGTVSGVYVVPGFSTVVIVSHGDYYTVYGNISSASVKAGDKVKQGQSVGRLAEDADNPGHSSLHFEVWKGREKLNPQSWIR